MHIAVDVEFTDGSFLSELGAIDQYDTKLNPCGTVTAGAVNPREKLGESFVPRKIFT